MNPLAREDVRRLEPHPPPRPFLVRLRSPDVDHQALTAPDDIGRVEGHQLGAPEGGGEADQEQCPVPLPFGGWKAAWRSWCRGQGTLMGSATSGAVPCSWRIPAQTASTSGLWPSVKEAGTNRQVDSGRMAGPWERRHSATGGRVHWAGSGLGYALCGSAVVTDGPPDGLSSGLPECGLCARKHARLSATTDARRERGRR